MNASHPPGPPCDDLAERLAAALSTGLPEASVADAKRLLARLSAPVRAAVIGPPRSGKTDLARLLSGLDDLAVEVMPLDADMSAQPLGPRLAAADIVLWCARDFGPGDAALWGSVPDPLKDHSFLVITHADVLAAEGRLPQTLTAIGARAADEFHSIFPLVTPRAAAAAEAGDGEALKASGGAALLLALRRQIALGREADRDLALLLLDRHPTDPVGRVSATDNWIALQPVLDSGRSRIATAGTDPAALLAAACETAQELAGTAATLTPDPLAEEILGVADTMLLLQMEGGPGPAADAIALLVQVRDGVLSRTAPEPVI